jgi:hypothetical protein
MIGIFWLLIFGSLGYGSTELVFLGDYTSPKNMIFENTLIGGLSGLFYKDNLVWAVSDDKGQYNQPRIYAFNILIEELNNIPKQRNQSVGSNSENRIKFSVNPSRVLFLKNRGNAKFKHFQIDSESLISYDKGWLISSEGNYSDIPMVLPSLIIFNSQGQITKKIGWPTQFVPNSVGLQTKGLRRNYAFEGLSEGPNKKYYYAIHEAPLIQESIKWRAGEGGQVHLLRFKITSDASQIIIDKDVRYEIDAYKNSTDKILASGISELLAIADDKVLVLERAIIFSSVSLFRFEAKIYEVSFKEPVKKKLILNLTDVKRLFRTSRELDNFEGMAFGPIVNNHQTLLIVSDDNFNPLENTVWLLFKLNLESQ